jgi:hypothetical protein
MASEPGEGIYRAMVEENALPKLGMNATTLGIRRDKDIVPDQGNQVHRPRFQSGEKNGLSCAPEIQSLPPFALPIAWGGGNRNTDVWRIAESDLGSNLVVREDTAPGGKRHLSIGPAQTMSFDDYVRLIEATRPKWRKVIKP